MPDYPKLLRTGGSSVFERAPEFYALRSAQPAGAKSAAIAVVQDGELDVFEIHRGPSGRSAGGPGAGPVYSAGPGGPLAVPTGRVLVRLTKGMQPEERRREFDSAGYEIERTMSYAPSSAWLKPRQGDVARALSNLDALEKVPGVEHVEPQLLLARVFKHA